MTNPQLEEGHSLQLDFSKLKALNLDVIPAVVQDAATKEVLILAYVTKEAIQLSFEKKIAIFWSTSRNELWIKGETSDDYLELVEIRVNCEQNSVLYLVKPKKSNACHTKRKSCYYRSIQPNLTLEFLD